MTVLVIDVAARVWPFFLLVAAGFALTRLSLLDARMTQGLSTYVYWVGFPALLIHSLSRLGRPGPELTAGLVAYALVGLLIMGGLLVVGRLLGWTPSERAGAAMGENVDHRQHEAGRLARARLGDADNVPHHEDGRNCLRLDRRRCVVTGFGYGLEQFVGKAEIGKSHSIVRDRRLIRPARMRDGNPPRIAKILATCQENRANERLWRTISHLHRPG